MALLLNAGDTVSRSYSYTQPSPLHPSQPQGTGERTGNLFDIGSVTHQTLSPDGTISYESAMDLSGFIKVNGDFTVSWTAVRAGAYMRVSIYDDNKTFIERVTATNTYNNTQYSYSHSGYIRINYENSYGLTNIMLNSGSTALPYEPYGFKIGISSANTTTPVYLGDVQTTRRVKKLVLTGNETVAGSAVTGGWIITNLSDSINNTTGLQTSYCSHYLSKNNGAMSSLSQGEMCISTQVNNRINFVTTFATAEDFKSYLAAQYAAGTPVTVWYVLATEETGIINEPLMKIGDYADSISGISIPTTAGANTLDVQTTLKPSEVTASFNGWHPVSAAHERSGGSWT